MYKIRYCMNCQKVIEHRQLPISRENFILKCVVCGQEEKAVKIKEIPEECRVILPKKEKGGEKMTLSEALKRLRQSEM